MLKNYYLLAFRFLSTGKVYTTINLIGLIIGISSFLLISLYTSDELTFDARHPRADELYRVVNHAPENEPWLKGPHQFPGEMASAVPEIENFTRLFPSKGHISANHAYHEENRVMFADKSFFQLFSYALAYGEYRFANDYSALITQSMAVKYFGTTSPIGQTLSFYAAEDTVAQSFTVTGVLKDLPSNTHLHFDFLIPYREGLALQGNGGVYAYFLLRDGSSAATVEKKFTLLNPANHAAWKTDIGQTIQLQPVRSIHLDSHFGEEIEANGNRDIVYMLAFSGFLILSIALINYVNISLARSIKRAKEVGVRKVLGAVRRQILQQFLIESLTLLIIASVISVAVVQLVLPFFNAFSGKNIDVNYAAQLPLMMLVILVTGFAASAYPAVLLSGVHPAIILKDTAALGFRKGTTFRNFLMVSQFSIGILLLITTLTMWKQLQFIQNKPLGFDHRQIAVIKISNPETQSRCVLVRQKFKSCPGVAGAAMANAVPGENFSGWPYQLPAASSPTGQPLSLGTTTLFVDEEYFSLMQFSLLAGRKFDVRNLISDSDNSVVVNESFLKSAGWTSPEESLGKVIQYFNSSRRQFSTAKVIGVVQDFNFESLHRSVEPLILRLKHPSLTDQGFPSRMNTISVKIEGPDTQEVLTRLKAKWNEIDPVYPFEAEFLDDKIQKLYEQDTKVTQLFTLFSALSLILTSLGILGISMLVIEQRSKEISIRKVLGATLRDILVLLSSRFATLLTVSFVFAAPVGIALMNHWLEGYSYRITLSALLVVAAGLIVGFFTLLTVVLQASKAAAVNPVDALQSE